MRIIGTFEGSPVHEVTLRSPGGAVAKIMSWGAVVRDLTVKLKDGRDQRVVLGFETFEPYPLHSPYFGAICGRVANRIRDGRFTHGGRDYVLPKNDGNHSLHGGPGAMPMRNWQILAHDAASVTLCTISPDGENGFAGTVTVTCVYRLSGEADLTCDLTATTDAETPVNLAQHNYYNLDGSTDIGGHILQVMADFHTPNDADLNPTGEIRLVAGGAYDFRSPRPIRLDVDGQRFTYDGNFVLRSGGRAMTHAATVRSPLSNVSLEVWTDDAGLQFYDASTMDIPVPGLDGQRYKPFGAFCLEPQKFPDAMNLQHFPDTLLRPGDVYRQNSLYRFKALPT